MKKVSLSRWPWPAPRRCRPAIRRSSRQGTLAGGALGAGAGALIGSAVTHGSAGGAIAGGLIGAGTGALIGNAATAPPPGIGRAGYGPPPGYGGPPPADAPSGPMTITATGSAPPSIDRPRREGLASAEAPGPSPGSAAGRRDAAGAFRSAFSPPIAERLAPSKTCSSDLALIALTAQPGANPPLRRNHPLEMRRVEPADPSRPPFQVRSRPGGVEPSETKSADRESLGAISAGYGRVVHPRVKPRSSPRERAGGRAMPEKQLAPFPWAGA